MEKGLDLEPIPPNHAKYFLKILLTMDHDQMTYNSEDILANEFFCVLILRMI